MNVLGAVSSAAVLSFLMRKCCPAFRWTLTGTVFLALALVVWFAFTAPIAINLGLPALFLILRVPSFEVGDGALWILRFAEYLNAKLGEVK